MSSSNRQGMTKRAPTSTIGMPTMRYFLLIVHGLLAVALLGAVTHQTISVLVPGRKTADSFVGRMRAVSAPSYVSAIIFLYVATAILGGIIYAEYRMAVRVVLEQLDLW